MIPPRKSPTDVGRCGGSGDRPWARYMVAARVVRAGSCLKLMDARCLDGDIALFCFGGDGRCVFGQQQRQTVLDAGEPIKAQTKFFGCYWGAARASNYSTHSQAEFVRPLQKTGSCSTNAFEPRPITGADCPPLPLKAENPGGDLSFSP